MVVRDPFASIRTPDSPPQAPQAEDPGESEERFGLSWHGKARARRLAFSPPHSTLKPCPAESVAWDSTEHLFIEGDNLEALKLLQETHAGKVKLIYIDPPYNTGKDFIYPDNFHNSLRSYRALTAQSEPPDSAESETSGRFHTHWLNMMYPRLLLSRALLREDGVIFVSIDHHELHHLMSMLHEIFGEEHFLGIVAVQLNPRGRHLDRFFATTHEYLCVFAKDIKKVVLHPIGKDERMQSEYNKRDAKGRYREIELRNRTPAFNRQTRPTLFYPIYVNPVSGEVSLTASDTFSVTVYPRNSAGEDSCWAWSREKLAAQRTIVLGRQIKRGGWRIFRKDYLITAEGSEATTLPKALWLHPELNNDVGKKRVQSLLESSLKAESMEGEGGLSPALFDFPKSPFLLEQIIRIGGAKEGIVLDFFAGSGTTGDAVMSLNAQDGGRRTFVLVQLPHSTGRKSFPTIAELTKERLRQAGAALRRSHPDSALDTGFRVLKLVPRHPAESPECLEAEPLRKAGHTIQPK